MIPYDDLVARLQSWRARQGLPVSRLPDAHAPVPPEVRGAADAYPEEHLEVLEEEHDHHLSLSSIDSDESTPIGEVPELRRSR